MTIVDRWIGPDNSGAPMADPRPEPAGVRAIRRSGISDVDRYVHESFMRDQQIYLSHLADALARPGKQRDLDAAADRGRAAVHLAENLISTRGTDCIHDLYRQMQPYASIPAVGDLLEWARKVPAA